MSCTTSYMPHLARDQHAPRNVSHREYKSHNKREGKFYLDITVVLLATVIEVILDRVVTSGFNDLLGLLAREEQIPENICSWFFLCSCLFFSCLSYCFLSFFFFFFFFSSLYFFFFSCCYLSLSFFSCLFSSSSSYNPSFTSYSFCSFPLSFTLGHSWPS